MSAHVKNVYQFESLSPAGHFSAKMHFVQNFRQFFLSVIIWRTFQYGLVPYCANIKKKPSDISLQQLYENINAPSASLPSNINLPVQQHQQAVPYGFAFEKHE